MLKSKWHLIATVVFSISLVSSCSSGPHRSGAPAEPQPQASVSPYGENPPQGTMISPEPVGPPAPVMGPEPPAQVYGPEPLQIRPITLVLGPGLARAQAFAGALRALSDAKIPIGAIFASEMGSLVAALYALDGQVNAFEWRLMHFKEETFTSRSPMAALLKRPSDGGQLRQVLEKVFGEADLKVTKIPCRISIQTADGGAVTIVDAGKISQLLRVAVTEPEIMTPQQWNGAAAVANLSRPYLIREAKLFSGGPVVVLDVLSERVPKDTPEKEKGLSKKFADVRVRASDELKEADLVIRPSMKGIGYLDYKKQTESAFRGKSAVHEKLSEIRHLVGLPENGVEQ